MFLFTPAYSEPYSDLQIVFYPNKQRYFLTFYVLWFLAWIAGLTSGENSLKSLLVWLMERTV